MTNRNYNPIISTLIRSVKLIDMGISKDIDSGVKDYLNKIQDSTKYICNEIGYEDGVFFATDVKEILFYVDPQYHNISIPQNVYDIFREEFKNKHNHIYTFLQLGAVFEWYVRDYKELISEKYNCLSFFNTGATNIKLIKYYE